MITAAHDNSGTAQIVGSIRDIVHDQITQHIVHPKEMSCIYELAFIWNESSDGYCAVTILTKVVAKHESKGVQVQLEWATTTLSGKCVDIQRVALADHTTMFHFTWAWDHYEECLLRLIIDHERSEWRWYALSGYCEGEPLEKKDIRLQIKNVSADATTSDLPVNQLN